MTTPATRIAMWSGPRNISTAMMRAWENRSDCVVVDEPFYAHYLRETGVDHPGRDEIIASQDTDWRRVAEALVAPLPPGISICYQKHMTHHLLPGMEGAWMDSLTHAFLIRDPAEIVASYRHRRDEITARDLGVHRQLEIWRYLADRHEKPPVVVESRDVLEDPDGMLRSLCRALGVTFDSAMLRWPPGRRESDGVWAPYWYSSVEKSTGFTPYRPRRFALSPRERAIAESCKESYEFLRERRLRAAGRGERI